MKRSLAFPLACLCVPMLARTQTPDPSKVTQALTCDNPATCSRGYINGRKYEAMTSDNKVAVFVVGDIFGKYLRADIYVMNGSDGTVDVLPATFVLLEVAPKQKVLKYVDGDKLMRSEEKRLAWSNALTAMSGNMARQQSTTNTTASETINATSSTGTTATGTYHGTSTSTTTAPDYSAQARATQTIRARNEAFNNLASVASRVILRNNTVSPNQSVHGFVLFEHDRKAKTVLLSCVLGNTIYQFPFDL